MFARAITLLAIIAIAVVTTMTAAHAARMNLVPDQAVHMAAMMQAPHGDKASCDTDRPCNPAEAGICEFVCTGLAVVLSSPLDGAEARCLAVSHDRPAPQFLASRAPGLNDRPPKTRLL